MSALRSAAALVVAVGCLTCGGEPPEGELVFQLTTPNQDDGAVQFTVSATEPYTLSGITALCSGCQVFTHVVSEAEIRGVLLGDIPAGPALGVTVSDRGADGYAATVVSAASRTYALRNPTEYALARE